MQAKSRQVSDYSILFWDKNMKDCIHVSKKYLIASLYKIVVAHSIITNSATSYIKQKKIRQKALMLSNAKIIRIYQDMTPLLIMLPVFDDVFLHGFIYYYSAKYNYLEAFFYSQDCIISNFAEF